MSLSELPPKRKGTLGITLVWYVITELIRPTLLALGGLTALVLTKDLLGFSDLVINRGFGASAVAMIALYEIIPLLSRTLPFALLIGTLVGLGRLRADLEVLSMEAAGISVRRLVYPVLLWGAIATVLGFMLSLVAAPWATRSLDAALQRMAAENPGLSLRAGTVYDFSGVKMLAREVSARGDHLRGILLWLPEQGQTLFAEHGDLLPLGQHTTQLTLHEGVMLPSPPERGEATRFGSFIQTLQENPTPARKEADVLPGESLTQLLAHMQQTGEKESSASLARVEFHHRLAYPVAALVLGLLAVPLSLAGKRFSRAAGGVTGLLVTVVYYGLMQLGDGLVQARAVPLILGVWLANIVIAIVAILLIWRVRKWATWGRQAGERTTSEEPAPTEETSHPRVRRFVLQRYVTQQYLTMLLLAFGMLFVGYLLVDILERLQWFARHQAHLLAVLRFYGARTPLLASRVIPMSLLLATALTVSILTVHREIIGMRACGVSVPRALAPILLICGLILPAYFLLNELVVPRTNALADQLKDEEIKRRGPEANLRQRMIWYQDSTHLYQASALDSKVGEAQGLAVYELNDSGLPVSRIDAREARHIGKGVWELIEPVRIGISAQGLQPLPAASRIVLGEAPSTTPDSMHLNTTQLAEAIRDVETSGYSATTYRVDWHVKLAAPFACLLLPAAALFFAVSGPPFPGPAVTILTCSVLGVAYVLLTGVFASLGYGGKLPPPLAGWSPVLLLTGLALALMLRGRQ
ncbi:MAG: LptF/LptG family permease [Deltaproteobacteria bacterium]|nr:LptF/LptG family permease [Deltaproteobacteria bacterium]